MKEYFLITTVEDDLYGTSHLTEVIEGDLFENILAASRYGRKIIYSLPITEAQFSLFTQSEI